MQEEPGQTYEVSILSCEGLTICYQVFILSGPRSLLQAQVSVLRVIPEFHFSWPPLLLCFQLRQMAGDKE